MDLPVNRRELFTSSGALVVASLAGCSYFGDSSQTTVRVRNHSDAQELITLSVLDPDEDERAEATLFREQFELEGRNGDTVDSQEFENAFESTRVIVEVETNDLLRQFDYFPHCPEEDSNHLLDITVSPEVSYTVSCRSE